MFEFALHDTRVTLSFLDSAGEELGSTTELEHYYRYLASADGLIFLLDPAALDGAAPHLEPGVERSLRNRADDALMNVTQTIRGLKTEPAKRILGRAGNGKIETPIAVTVTKLDTLLRATLNGTSLTIEPDHRGFYDASTADRAHEDVKALLHTCGAYQIDAQLSQNYRKYRYFGVSALGHSPDDNTVSARGIQPVRVGDPLLWLFSEFGLVKKRS